MSTTSSFSQCCERLGEFFGARAYSSTNPYDGKRTLTLNAGPQSTRFISNRISTSKYSALTFLPKFLFEQFRKYSNIFFLSIVVFQVNERERERSDDR